MKKDRSVYYWLVDMFSTYPAINIVDGFPVENLVIPTVSIESKTLTPVPWEIGNRERSVIRVWFIDVFAANKNQRDELGYRIIDGLENSIPVYDYDEGFPPTVSPTRIGALITKEIRMDIIKIMPQLVEKMYYRCTISFVTEYNQL